jgi:hypothetical protein
MAYTPDMSNAARRHLLAANILYSEKTRIDVAGYLYGIAAECAIKAMMLEAGIRPDLENRKGDPFFAHFPGLRTMLKDSLQGRKSATLRLKIENDNFFSQWDIEMRYCKSSDIRDSWVETWKEQANDIVSCIGT